MAESVAEFFLTNFQAHGEERAYGQRHGYRMEWFTYGQVLEMAFRFAGDLEARGIGKGERVMLWGENCAEWVAAFFGCALRGVVVVPMDDGASRILRGGLRGRLRRGFGFVRGGMRRSTSFGSSVPVIALEEVKIPALSLQERRDKDGAPAANPPTYDVAIGRDDILQIVFTSGTTAEPKGVVITHGNVLANIAPLEREMQRYLKYERWVHPVRFLEFAAVESRLWAIPRDVSASAAGWDGDFSGRAEAVGDCEHDPAGAGLSSGECAESLAIPETED